MGRVFTWEEVCRRHVPTERSFEMVMSYLQKALADATVAGIVQGAVVCGSVGRGDGDDLRRDLDCFVVYEYERRAEAVAVLQAATAIAKQFFVELAIIPANSQIVSTSLHHFGPAFLEHLEWSVAEQVLVTGNPLSLIAQSVTKAEEVEWYLRAKSYNLEEAFMAVRTFSPERQASYLRKVLEAPMHVARKMLAYAGALTEDSKEYVRHTCTSVFPLTLSLQLKDLLTLDSLYTNELRTHLGLGAAGERGYSSLLQHLIEESSRVFDFIVANIMYIEESKAR